MPRASLAQGERTVRTEVFFLAAGFFEGRFRAPRLPDLREGEVFVGMFSQA
jgi:hypothetical protein